MDVEDALSSEGQEVEVYYCRCGLELEVRTVNESDMAER